MKTTCFTGALCLLLTACEPKIDYDVDGPTLGAQDFSVIEGDWVGTLTYSDYGSGELTVIATKSIVTSISDTKIKYTIFYPDEPWEDSKSTIKVSQSRTANSSTYRWCICIINYPDLRCWET